jgi:phosphoenolpyruvate carboxylase
MHDPLPPAPAADQIVADLLAMTAGTRKQAADDPFANPGLSLALAISRRIDAGELPAASIETAIAALRDAAFADRAKRLAGYAGADAASLERLAAVVAGRSDSFQALRESIERCRFAAVFTAHPTFALRPETFRALAAAASGEAAAPPPGSQRPTRPTLDEEFEQAGIAIANGRDAIDRLNAALLTAAREEWPRRWSELVPRPVLLASWVGYDTDGRTDIGWNDTLRLRLRMKRLQLVRAAVQLSAIPAGAPAAARVSEAIEAVEAQIAACPATADPDNTAAFAAELVGKREAALLTPAPVVALIDAAIPAAEDADKLALAVARAGLAGFGLGLAHMHVRLNASQLHNVTRQRLGLSDSVADPSRRRALLNGINAALDAQATEAVDFGTLLAEQTSAAKLMMTVAEIVRHIDAAIPVRFLIAETESGYTLLAALWLARLFGIDRQIEISPLFETGEALERGARVLEEALRSPHWRSYLRTTGRLALQFGYSDSGRYIGQLAASNLIERLRLRLVDTLRRHGLADIEVVLFDTHGESVGRGAHPGSLEDRLKYLSPTQGRRAFLDGRLAVREESAFQGGDGYLHFGTPSLAVATIAGIARHAFAEVPEGSDPIYDDPDFAADFFASIGVAMRELVEDPGYAALLGAFGPALLDPTGSRPSARQSEGIGGPQSIRHPRELRAIPNNAILQQLGWMANTLHGLGEAVSRQPDVFADLRTRSNRFRRALDLARHAAMHSDIDVLRAVVSSLDPGMWLDRAAHATVPGRREALIAVATALERLDLWAVTQRMFRRVQADHLAMRGGWPDIVLMADREVLLHALRLALVHRIWLLAVEVPDFSPRFAVTAEALRDRLLRLDVPAALDLLHRVFPAGAETQSAHDYAEAGAARRPASYAREHAEIFAPMARYFAMVREIGVAITHEVGAFG